MKCQIEIKMQNEKRNYVRVNNYTFGGGEMYARQYYR